MSFFLSWVFFSKRWLYVYAYMHHYQKIHIRVHVCTIMLNLSVYRHNQGVVFPNIYHMIATNNINNHALPLLLTILARTACQDIHFTHLVPTPCSRWTDRHMAPSKFGKYGCGTIYGLTLLCTQASVLLTVAVDAHARGGSRDTHVSKMCSLVSSLLI